MKLILTVAFLFNSKSLLVGATNFRSRYGSDSQWTPNVLTSQDNIRSIIECASLCARESETCGGFMYPSDDGSCTLANQAVSCIPRPNNLHTGLKYYTKTRGSPVAQLIPSANAMTYLLASASDKAKWTATASSWYDEASPDLTIDGDSGGGRFATAAGAVHSWVQVDMGEIRWVRGGRMKYSINLRQMYTEVRVGEQDVQDSPDDEILCKNHFCYRTDNDMTTPLSFECKDPLQGRYMTLQKYNNYPGDHSYIDLIEVDVEVYCGNTKDEDGACETDQSFDICPNKDLITENTELASTAAQKSDWTVEVSSSHVNAPNFNNIIDGLQSASADNQVFYTNTGDMRPWVQLDIAQTRIVKAVHIYSKIGGSQGYLTQYIEVRIGDTDAAATVTAGQRICANTLCKTTVGAQEITSEKSDCAGGVPIQGRYVTMQRFKVPVAGKEMLGLAEVDIEFYI